MKSTSLKIDPAEEMRCRMLCGRAPDCSTCVFMQGYEKYDEDARWCAKRLKDPNPETRELAETVCKKYRCAGERLFEDQAW